MAADIDIINAALSKLGEQPILAISDPSPAARLADRTYADIRDALFEEYAWNFATKRASLSAEQAAPIWGFARAFNLPSDLLRLIELNNVTDEEWRHEGNQIVTDKASPLEIKYVGLVVVDLMTPTFKEALASRLAMEWAEPLAQTTTVVNSMALFYRNKLQVARIADGQTDRRKVIDSSDFIVARF